VLLWAGLLTASSTNAQDITSTSNLLTMGAWTGITYSNNAGVGQCCSGGPMAAMNQDTNTLRFSFGSSTAIQTVGINHALSAAGTGIKVTGFSYSWMVYNNLKGSSDTRGTLTANVSVIGKDSKVVENYNYNYSNEDTGAAFKEFSGTETFSKLYAPTSLGDLTVSFTGQDKNFWAGYYGPRVRNASLSLNYSAGGSTADSGGSTSGSTIPTATSPKAGTTVTITTTDTTSATAVTTVNAGGVTINAGEIAVVDNIPQVVKDAAPAPAAATAAVPNPFLRDANDLGTKKEEKKVARAVVKPAETVLPKRTVQQDGTAAVAATAAQNDTATQDFWGSQLRAATVVTRRVINVDTDDAASRYATDVSKAGALSVNPTNLLNMTMNGPTMDNSAASAATSTVKRNVANNELAGGIDLTKMAVQPIGFNGYLNLTLTDASFYAPKEAYPNQRVVDNARAQRLLQGASDRLHQQMVDSQYEIKP